MPALFSILCLIISTITNGENLLNTTATKIQNQIDAGIKFMCINQFRSNGQFLYELELGEDNIVIDIDKNNAPRQGGGLYGIGMYYRLNHHRHDDKQQGYSIINCIDNTMQYLQSQSLPIIFKKELNESNQIYNEKLILQIRGSLIDGNTGATALAMMGLIEICIINDNICSQKYSNQLIEWLKGLITMRNHKLIQIDNNILNKGAFIKKLKYNSKSSPYYDSESYVALSKILKYKFIFTFITEKLWTDITEIVNGLDEYYIEYKSFDDTHWLLQAWYNRWVLLNQNIENQIDNFMNYYMIQILLKNKLENKININYDGARCYLVEAITDVIYSINIIINNSKYNNNKNNTLYKFNDLLYKILNKRYKFITERQLFMQNVSFYFEERFNGGFRSDSNDKLMRIDDTQHCVCALMKLNALIFMAKNVDKKLNSYSYIDYNDPLINDFNNENMFGNATNYDIMISAICLVVVIVLVNIVFFYWCYYYPKQQKERNDLFWLGQTMESAASDVGNVDSEVA